MRLLRRRLVDPAKRKLSDSGLTATASLKEDRETDSTYVVRGSMISRRVVVGFQDSRCLAVPALG